MYQVVLDGRTLYYPGDGQAVVLSPQLSLSAGYAGEFTCDVPASNPLYDQIKNRSSMVSVYRDKKELFYGEVRTCQTNQWKDKNIYCAGAMSFLSDSIQPQAEYHDMTPRQMLETFLGYHNDQVDERKKIKAGIVTIHDTNDSLYRYTNFETTLDAIRDKLVDRLGGYLRLRHEPDGLYLDWVSLAEFGKLCEQTIDFGENLLDYSESLDSLSLITALIPLGSRIEQTEDAEQDPDAIGALEKYTDITSVNGGKNFIYSEEAVTAFGWVCGINRWDDVAVPSNLLRKGREYLTDNQFEQLTLELTALDLSLMDASYDSFDCGDRIRCRAMPYGMDRTFPVMELSIPLAEPENATLKLGETKSRGGLTGEVSSSVARVEREAKEREYEMTDWLGSAIDNATEMMTGSKYGYKRSEFDEEKHWLRDLYMDAPVKEDATNVLQINPNGIGFSRTGYEGPYLNAWTIDGTFMGEFIQAHSIKAEALSTEYTEHVETLIEDAETGAKEYADDKVTTSVKSLEGQITLAVDTERTRASGIEESLSSRIQVNQESITSEVSRAKGVESSLSSRITQTESEISSKVSRGDVSSMISQSAEEIRLQATKLSWSSTYSSMTSDGKLTCQSADINGTLKTKNVDVLDDEIVLRNGNTIVGRIKYDTTIGTKPAVVIKTSGALLLDAGDVSVPDGSDWVRNGLSGTYRKAEITTLTFAKGLLIGVNVS